MSLLEVWRVAGRPLRQADRLQGRGPGRLGVLRARAIAGPALVRGTGLGSLDEVETYHDRIRETVVNMLARRPA